MKQGASVTYPTPHLVEYQDNGRVLRFAAELCPMTDTRALVRVYLPLVPEWPGGEKLGKEERLRMLGAIQETMRARGLETMFTLAME